MKNLSQIIRIVTVAPVIAFLMLLILFLQNAALFGSPVHFLLAILFLTIFPLLAYPLQPFFKKYKGKGREGQRALAINFAVAGYIGGCLSAIFWDAPKSVRIIYLTYLLSGVLILLSTKLLHFKASGHACGVAGPCAFLLYFGEPLGFFGIPILALAWLSSLSMKRHTAAQLLGGTLIPIIALGIVISI
ncbi:hypothetical protein SDC9_76522 [bioreactor metagenome]|uniref:Phosphatidic acid phosphatase type 2/haloperoxidase domain-containing protein n=1 Tax=bioreactor metagenome TaxID=1076179 RepID=A0A644YNG0_9ZZZZ